MYLKNLSWLAIEKVAKLLSMFITSIIISRTLGVSDFGQYSFVISITLILTPIVMFGFDEYYFQKFITVKSKKFEKKLLNICLTIRIMFSIILIITILVIYLVTKELIFLYLIMASIHFSFSSLNIFSIYNNSKLRSNLNAKVNVIVSIVFILVRIMLWYESSGISMFLLTYSFELILTGILLYRTYHGKVSFEFDFIFILKIYKKIFPLILSSLAVVIYYKVDQMMLGFMVDFHSVGIYAVQAQLVLAVNLILQILINGTFPAWFENGKIQDKYLIGTYKISLIFSILSIVISLSFSTEIITFFWGESFSESADILTITLFGTLFSGMGFIASKQMINLNLQYLRMKRIIGGMIVNIILNLVLIPFYGVYGAAISTVVANFYSGLLGNAISKETRSVIIKQLLSFKLYKLDEIVVLIRRLKVG
ncbi:flippase [Vibrio parahaemolyticus]|uniref:flippase n=1 Tax=Vibrio harveyi group TaxID=717610 RepID=UPI0021D2D38E|nr:flippase [Vibrio parahaemolyticus]